MPLTYFCCFYELFWGEILYIEHFVQNMEVYIFPLSLLTIKQRYNIYTIGKKAAPEPLRRGTIWWATLRADASTGLPGEAAPAGCCWDAAFRGSLRGQPQRTFGST